VRRTVGIRSRRNDTTAHRQDQFSDSEVEYSSANNFSARSLNATSMRVPPIRNNMVGRG